MIIPGDPLSQRAINVDIKWRADVIKSNFHVTQEMFDPERSVWLYDSWVCKGSKAWRTIPLWIHFYREELDPLNHLLTTAPALAVAKAAVLVGESRSKEGSNYVVFNYNMPHSAMEIWSLLSYTASSETRVSLWFTLEQGHLVKFRAGPLRINNSPEIRWLEQAFVCHDERIKIRGPRWINAIPSEDGSSFRILEGVSMDIVAHHGEKPEPPKLHIGDSAEYSINEKDAGFGSKEIFDTEFLYSYYRSPKPEDEIASFIRAVMDGGYFDDIHLQKTFAPFFAVIFSKYPDRAEEWASTIKNEGTRIRILELFQSIDVLLKDPLSVANNDECWGAYYASGDKRFLNKLIEITRYASDHEDVNLLAAGSSAKWSLASNAENDPTIWTVIESAIAGGRDDLRELLTEEPVVFVTRMRDTLDGIDTSNREA